MAKVALPRDLVIIGLGDLEDLGSAFTESDRAANVCDPWSASVKVYDCVVKVARPWVSGDGAGS